MKHLIFALLLLGCSTDCEWNESDWKLPSAEEGPQCEYWGLMARPNGSFSPPGTCASEWIGCILVRAGTWGPEEYSYFEEGVENAAPIIVCTFEAADSCRDFKLSMLAQEDQVVPPLE